MRQHYFKLTSFTEPSALASGVQQLSVRFGLAAWHLRHSPAKIPLLTLVSAFSLTLNLPSPLR